MKRYAAAIAWMCALVLSACVIVQQPSFEYVGEWSNVIVSQGEDPHASGYTLKLWKNEGKPIGFLSEYVGPPADPPLGPLQDITHDTGSGRISFAAKMTTGITFSAKYPDGASSRTLYVFSGFLNDAEVRGVLEMQDRLNNNPPVRMDVVLKRVGDKDTAPRTHRMTLKEWEAFYAPILRARGPKW